MKDLCSKTFANAKTGKRKRITEEVARNIKEDLRQSKYLEANIKQLREALERLENKYNNQYSFRSLAVKHRCSVPTIKDIKYNRSWKDVKIKENE